MILVTLRVTAPAGRREELVEVFWLLLGPTQAEPGCLGCRLYQEIGEGESLLYLEEWQTSEDLERHMRSPRYERLLAVMEASARPPVLRYQSIGKCQGLEYLEDVRLRDRAAWARCREPETQE